MKRKPLKSMVYKDEMGFVCLNTRYGEMRHLVYASHNGSETQRKTVTEKEHSIYIYANVWSAWGPWSKEVDKAWWEIQRLWFPLISPLYLWVLTKGLVDMQHGWEKLNTQQEHRYSKVIKAPTKLGGVLIKKNPNYKATHFIPTLFSPPCSFLHSLPLGMEQWVKSS